MSKRTCRLCGESPLKEVLVMENAPRNISRLLTSDEFSSDTPITLRVYQCMACGHVQLMENPEDTYYEDYLMMWSHSPQMRTYQRQQAFEFVSQFKLTRRKVIEVGCGDGNYLHYLAEAGADVTGVEPSQRLRALARQRGFKVLAGYMGRDYQVEGEPYDAFVARQVLEHVPAPNEFLLGIRSALTQDGVGLVEVPSLEHEIENRWFYEFFSDHLSYFSARTLRLVLERNGFDVLDMSRGMNDEYLVAFVRIAPLMDLAPVRQAGDIVKREVHRFVQMISARGGRVAVWGAGYKGIAALASIKVEEYAYVIDSDPIKQGHFTPVSHFPIVAPAALETDPVDAVIVLAPTYRDEIVHRLQQEIRFSGIIAVVGREGLEIVQEG